YSASGIPYKRGILLQGPPGTGKSSISLALAGHIRASLYNITIGEVRNGGHLVELFLSARHGSVVLLEDIDSAGIGREKVSISEDSPNASKNGEEKPNSDTELAEDGVVLIMTTNEPENLDKALIRPGRIDKQIHVGHASRAVAGNIFTRFYSDINNERDVSDYISEMAIEFVG
ncbi:P-loop containing nucleoside triphosphate hydrolase protein, partial [Paraphaeosphaeria sporulosa]